MKMGGSLFWGIVLIIIGVSLIIKVVFNCGSGFFQKLVIVSAIAALKKMLGNLYDIGLGQLTVDKSG